MLERGHDRVLAHGMLGLEGHREQVWEHDRVLERGHDRALAHGMLGLEGHRERVRDMLVLEGCMGLVLLGYKGHGRVRGMQVQVGYKGRGQVLGKLHRQVFDKLHKLNKGHDKVCDRPI